LRKGYALDQYGWIIEKLRLMLGNLSPETARKIAYDNAKKIFSIDEELLKPESTESPSPTKTVPSATSEPY
jgi:hypothetical protein